MIKLVPPLFVMLLVVIGAPRADDMREGIAAVVNEAVISRSDLEARMRLAIAASGLADSAELRDRLRPQVLRSLIDEEIQLQEAERLNITVAISDINDSFDALAQQSGLDREGFIEGLRERGVPVETIEQQVRAQIAWSRVIQRTVRREIEISEEEIDEALERLRGAVGKPEYLLAEIFLPVDTPDREAEIRRFAERLFEQVREGASFPALAQQFSQSISAAAGGDLGWVPADQLSERLNSAVSRMQPGTLSPPIRDVTGYHILLLRDSRIAGGGNIALTLKQIILPLEGRDPERVLAEAIQIREDVTSCAAIDRWVEETGSPMSGDLGSVTQADLPDQLARAVGEVQDGQLTRPLVSEQGVLMLAVCGRQSTSEGMPDRNVIANQLGMERLEILQRRYIRDLRSAAFIDVRA